MSKLCYKVNGTVKKYDLKDSVSGSPKLGVKVGGTTKYLGLKQGSKSGEVAIKVGGKTYYVQTKGYEGYPNPYLRFKNTYDDESIYIYCWPIYDTNKVVVAMILTCGSRVHERKGHGEISTAPVMAPSEGSIRSLLGFDFNPGYYNYVLCKIWCTGDAFSRESWALGTSSNIGIAKNRLLYGNDRYSNSSSGDIYEIRDLTETTDNWMTAYSGTTNLRSFDTSASKVSPNGFYTYYGGANTNHSWLQFLKYASNDSSKKYMGVYTGNHVYEYTRVANYDGYFEFPENGLIGATPTEVITEWANAIGTSTTLGTWY